MLPLINPAVRLGKTPLPYHVPVMKKLGITKVINLQDEYEGPKREYERMGIEQLYMPVVDHFEPSEEQIERGVQFIEKAIEEDTGVYVH